MSHQDIELLQTAVEKAVKLYSVFHRVSLGNNHYSPEKYSALSPSILSNDGLAPESSFEKLSLQRFLEDRRLLEENLHSDALEETTPYLFQKYGWRIADHRSTTSYQDAAFCDSFRAEQAMINAEPKDGYLLVKGDLTGIQEFIYNNIQPRQAGGLANLAKRLRARSILVSLLTDFIANIILRELNLSPWHLLFAGGGHFNLLIPGSENNRSRLKVLNDVLSRSMRHRFGEHLELIIASVDCQVDIRDNASEYFETVSKKRDWMKHRQHLGDLKELFNEEIVTNSGQREDNEQKIGREFPKQHFLLEIMSEKPLLNDNNTLTLAEIDGLTMHHTLLAVKTLDDPNDLYSAYNFLVKNKGNGIKKALVLAINNTEFLPADSWKDSQDFDFPVSFGFRFLGKNAPRRFKKDSTVEDENAEILDFNGLATGGQENRKKGEGFLRLGAVMLDIDNLGVIFSHGLQNPPLARIIALSRELNYFFTAHFDTRAKTRDIYIVYSGGDDAFAVGKWDNIIRFSNELHADFQRFICYDDSKNKDIHFSAGLFMSNPYYPIGRFYLHTQSQQKKAKRVPDKNSVDVFDYTLKWSSFTDKIDLGDKFFEVLKAGHTKSGRKFSSSFAYRIMQLVKTSYYERNEWRDGVAEKRGNMRMDKFARNVANMRYLFARNGFTESDIQKLTDELEQRLTQSFLKEVFYFDKNQYEPRDYLVALNFAMLQLRSTTNTSADHG